MKKLTLINFAPSGIYFRVFKHLRPWLLAVALAAGMSPLLSSGANVDVRLTGVPDYDWQYGCFGTASGIVMGYWDRHGFPDFYTGPTAGGVAPLNNYSINGGIRSIWASQAGFDGWPAGVFGHVDDYYSGHAHTGTDRFVLSNRLEHAADCLGDFMGMNQKKWTNLNNECDGNIDSYAFVFWQTNGTKRVNFVPPSQGTNEGRDIPSGLREWTRYRGYDADVFSQLVSFNPRVPPGQGFTFDDLRAEIDAGYPVLAFLQSYTELFRSLPGMPRANPEIHAMVIYGYQVYAGFGTNVYCRDSWGGGEQLRNWSAASWVGGPNLPLRGVIGYRPKPRMRSVSYDGVNVTVRWDGPTSELFDVLTGTTTALHHYQLERSLTLHPPDFQPVGSPTTNLTITLPECCADEAYYRVQLLPPPP